MHNQVSMPRVPPSAYPIAVQATSHETFQLRITESTPIHANQKLCLSQSIQIHAPHEPPIFAEFQEFAELKGSTNVEVTLEITRSDRSLRALKPVDRECFFKGERKLKYFKIYTQKYCEMECIMDYMVDACKCQMTNFIYGRHRKFEFCSGQDEFCINFQKQNLFHQHGIILEDNCTCLPTCNSVSYHVRYYPSDSSSGENETVITMRLNTEDLILFRRYQQFTFSDALSYVGGILGLFAGISMLSIVELIYFFTLRFVSDVVRHVSGN
jgi:amiloride-sensitive sodium channel